MFGSVLPGIRELRVPLAVGFLWFAVAWVTFSESFRNIAPNSFFSDVALLIEWFTVPVALSVLTFFAYLAGVILKNITFRPIARRLYSRDEFLSSLELRELMRQELKGARNRGARAQQILRDLPSIGEVESSRYDDEQRYLEASILVDENTSAEGRPSLDEAADWDRWHWIMENVDLFATESLVTQSRFSDFLMVTHKDAYDQMDRNLAEADFRESIGVPLVALAGVIASRIAIDQGSDWYFLIIAPILIAAVAL